MTNVENLEQRSRRGIYNEFKEGDQLTLDLKSFNPSGILQTTRKHVGLDRVIKDGGFAGTVCIARDTTTCDSLVIKTSQPASPFRDLVRRINWEHRPFPSQKFEIEAQTIHVMTKILNKTLPKLSENLWGVRFESPDSYGYFESSSGFNQAIEYVQGRGPRYEQGFDDYFKFKERQRQLYELLCMAGFENASQISPQNPLALPNIWFDEGKNIWRMMDTIPAFQIKPLQPGNITLAYQRDISQKFPGEVPFHNIRTDRLHDTLDRKSYLFSEGERTELDTYISLYNRLSRERARQLRPYPEEKKEKPLTFQGYWGDTPSQKWHVDKSATVAAAKAAVGEVGLKTAIGIKDTVTAATRLFFDKTFIPELIMQGVEEAHKRGTITEQEYQDATQAKSASQNDKKEKVLSWLIKTYGLQSVATKAAEFSFYSQAFLADDPWWASVIKGVVIGNVVPSVARKYIAKGLGKVTDTDLEKAEKAALVPTFAGAILAVTAQHTSDHGKKSDLIHHYSVRRHVAERLSRLHPFGGPNTDLEALAMGFVGKPVEKISK